MSARTPGRPAKVATLVALLSPLLAAPAAAAWPVPAIDGPGAPPLVRVQSTPELAQQSLRMDRMEEQMRQLNGRIDELTYQLRQLQDIIQRSREDTEFRLQELEGGAPKRRSDAAPIETLEPARPNVLTTGPADLPADLDNGFSMDADTAGAPPQTLGTMPAAPGAGSGPLDLSAIARGEDGYTMSDLTAPQDPAAGLPATDLPADVAVLGGPLDPADPSLAPSPPPAAGGGEQMAAVVLEEDPKTQYDRAYGYIVDGNYQMAEAGFRRFLEQNGSSPLAGDAHFWLGESLYARGDFRDAADAFLTTYRDYPASKKAPESLLKLGLSLEGLGETDAACATYRELEKKFPAAPAALMDRVSDQKSKAGC
jgi:tol-pal system protein YbgF